jgi:hypothetical protein
MLRAPALSAQEQSRWRDNATKRTFSRQFSLQGPSNRRIWTPPGYQREHGDKLAHLTIERIDSLAEWPLDEMNGALEKLIFKFKESLPPAKEVWFQLDEPAVQITLGHEGNNTVSGQVAAIIDSTTPS